MDERWHPDADGGEHHLLRVSKTGLNTQSVVDALARFSGVRPVDIGLFGLKDKHAVTSQWFSVYTGKRAAPDFSSFSMTGCHVLDYRRYPKKLRRGDHGGNDFEITLRLIDSAHEHAVNSALELLAENGFPNYFGPQRFGFDNANLLKFQSTFCDSAEPADPREARRARRKVNPMIISAARSHLFNCELARREEAGLPDPLNASDGCLPGGPLRSRDPIQKGSADWFRQQAWSPYKSWLHALHRLGERDMPRPLWIMPAQLRWEWPERRADEQSVIVSFGLPPGAYASVALSQVAVLTRAGHAGIRDLQDT